MPPQAQAADLMQAALRTLATNDRVNAYLIEHLSDELWASDVPGARKTVRALAAHIHNVRCMWVKMLGRKLGVAVPPRLDRAVATRKETIAAFAVSHRAMSRLLELGLSKGKLAGFPPDAMHFLGYVLAHDAHHRGQLCMIARELGHRLPVSVAAGLWQWSARAKEASGQSRK